MSALFDLDIQVEVPAGVRTRLHDGQRWYRLVDLFKRIGFRQLSRAWPEFLSEKDKIFLPGRGLDGKARTVRYVSERGMRLMACRCKKPGAAHLAAELGISVVHHSAAEAVVGRVIRAALEPMEVVDQYGVGRYWIDLYVPSIRVAIECDENDHVKLDREAERERQAFIEAQFGCVFVRFNPYERDFNIGNVINRVLRARPGVFIGPQSRVAHSEPWRLR